MIVVRRIAVGGLIAAAATLAACGKGGQGADSTGYARDADTGAASPAATPDYSATPRIGASTDAVSAPAGGPAVAGDTMGARKRAAGASTAAQPKP